MRGLVPYEYNPALDELELPDKEDLSHDPASHEHRKTNFPWRGILNVAVLVSLILVLLCLFVFYPVPSFCNEARNSKIDENTPINGTGSSFLPSSLRPFSPKLYLRFCSPRLGPRYLPDAQPH